MKPRAATLERRLAAVLTVLVVLFCGLAIWSSSREVSEAYRDAGEQQGRAVAAALSTDLRPGPVTERDRREAAERLRALVESGTGIIEATALTRGPRGPVVVASTDALASGQRILEVDRRALYEGRLTFDRESQGSIEVGLLSVPIARPGRRPHAALDLVVDERPLAEAVGRSRSELAVATAVIGCLMLLVALLTLRRLVFARIEALREATGALAAGRLATRVGAQRNDELGALARDFDDMAERLGRAQNRLQQQALTDPLTDLPNRRAFDDRLSDELALARREGHPVAVALLDIDRFKQLNDARGHAAGDEALRAVGEVLRTTLRPGDVCARLGGDEFAIILPRAGLGPALAAIRRILPRARALDLTLSGGVAVFPGDAISAATILAEADRALYRAKAEGRDRVHGPPSRKPRPLAAA